MAGHIGQGFLRHPEQGLLDVKRQGPAVLHLEIGRDAGVLRPGGQVFLQGAGQAFAFQRSRP